MRSDQLLLGVVNILDGHLAKLEEHGCEGQLLIKRQTKSKVNSSEFNLCTLSV